MHLPRQRRRLQRTAFAMLLVWLFALASTVAQACVTPMPAVASHGDHCALKAGHGAGTAGGQAAAKAACAKFCSDTTLPSAKASTVLDGPTGPQWLGAPPTVIQFALRPEPVAQRPQGPPGDRPLPAKASIPIAFLRLAL